jgi:hypothetical protein
MKAKHIIVCALILAALICILVLRNLLSQKPAGEIKLVRFGSAIEIENVQRIKFYTGANEKEAIELEKKDGAWVVATKFDAPAREDKIRTLLQDIKALGAEMRSDSPELFSEFALGDDEAVHIVLCGPGTTVLQHLLVGKESAGGRGVFVRIQGESRIYAVDKNIRRQLGIYRLAEGEKAQVKPEVWLDLEPFRNLKSEEVQKISVTSPGRHLVFERKEVESTEPQKEGEKKPALKTEWALSDESAPAPFKIKQEGVTQILVRLKNLRAEDIIDPEKEKECGFDSPTYDVLLKFKDNSEKRFITGSATGENKEECLFARIIGERLIWKMPLLAIQSIPCEARILFEMPVFLPDSNKLRVLTLCDPVKELVIEKVSGAWTLSAPQLPFEPREKALDRLIKLWSATMPDDIVNTKCEPDFTDPAYITELALSDGTRQIITVGTPVPGRGKERYLSISGREEIFTIKDYVLTNIFPPATNFFTVKILECDRNRVESIKLLRKDTELALRKTGKDESTYKAALFGYEFPANTDTVREILDNFTNTVPADVPGKVSAEKSGLDSPEFTLTLKLARAKELTLHIGKKTENGYFAQTADSPLVYTISEGAGELLAKPISEILNMKIFDFTPASVAKFALHSAGKEMSFEQNQKGEWVSSPESKVLKQDAVLALLDVLSNLCAADISSPQPLGEVGLEKPQKSVTIVTKDGKSNCLSVGAPVPAQKDLIYAKLDGRDGLIHLSATDTQKVFPEFGTLFLDAPPAPKQ